MESLLGEAFRVLYRFEVAESDSLQKTIPIGRPEQMVVNISSLLRFVSFTTSR